MAQGVAVRPVSVGMDHPMQAWINDPDGNTIELMASTPKCMQLERGKSWMDKRGRLGNMRLACTA